MGGLHGMTVFLRSATCSFFGVAVFLRCAGCFLKICLWAVYTGTPVFSLLRHLFFFWGGLYGDFRSFSAPLLVLFGAGSPFFLRFQCGAVLCFCCMARGARLCFLLCLGVWGAGLGLPSVGFVNAV